MGFKPGLLFDKKNREWYLASKQEFLNFIGVDHIKFTIGGKDEST